MKHQHLDDMNDPLNDPRGAAFDDALKQALRAEDPGAAFTQRVLARAREERVAQPSSRPLHAFGAIDAVPAATSRSEVSEVSARPEASTRSEVFANGPEVSSRAAEVSVRQPGRFSTTRKLIAAIAASLTLAAVGEQWLQHRRYVAEGERARAQVLEALRLTNEKLNFVHDKITERERAR